MDRLFFSALLLVRNESKEFTIASTRMSTERGDRTDKRGCGRMGAGQTRDSYFDYFLFF